LGPALDPVTSDYVRAVAERLGSAFHPDLAGVYLIGSAAMGGFDRDRSDVDIVAVVGRRLAPEEKDRIVNLLAHPALPCPVRKLELVVYPAEALRGPSPSLAWELNLNTGPEAGVAASMDPSSEPPHWFVLDVAMAREHAVTLVGPPPPDVFAEIAGQRVLQALIESVRWHREHDEDGIQSVLSACRALRYLADGTWVPKPEAARWARARAEDPSAVDAALAAWEGAEGAGLDRRAAARLLDDVERRLQGAVGISPGDPSAE
jgi:hypothetical protein